jgi:hypothetical protein
MSMYNRFVLGSVTSIYHGDFLRPYFKFNLSVLKMAATKTGRINLCIEYFDLRQSFVQEALCNKKGIWYVSVL